MYISERKGWRYCLHAINSLCSARPSISADEHTEAAISYGIAASKQ